MIENPKILNGTEVWKSQWSCHDHDHTTLFFPAFSNNLHTSIKADGKSVTDVKFPTTSSVRPLASTFTSARCWTASRGAICRLAAPWLEKGNYRGPQPSESLHGSVGKSTATRRMHYYFPEELTLNLRERPPRLAIGERAVVAPLYSKPQRPPQRVWL